MQKWGIVAREKQGQYDLTTYSVQRCREFGQRGVPAPLQDVARQHPVKDIMQVKSWAEAKKALASGYAIAVCSTQGFTMQRDANGICKPSGSWAHCMALIGYTSINGKEYGRIENSWGPTAHTGPLGPGSPPQSGFYAPEDARLTLPEIVGAKQKVGIAWSGNVKDSRNVLRLCPLALWADLLASPGVAFYSLQVGERAADVAQFNDVRHVLIDLSRELSDWAETAAAVAQLDLVITVDTGLAHLAGAMGKPVWVLLSQVPDARWMLESESCSWYPSMRLFRQQRLGDWAAVLDRVGSALRERMAAVD